MGRAAARTGDLRFVSVMPRQLSYSRILHEEDVLVVRSNNYQCRLQQLTAIDFWCSTKFETQTIEVSHYDGAHA